MNYILYERGNFGSFDVGEYWIIIIRKLKRFILFTFVRDPLSTFWGLYKYRILRSISNQNLLPVHLLNAIIGMARWSRGMIIAPGSNPGRAPHPDNILVGNLDRFSLSNMTFSCILTFFKIKIIYFFTIQRESNKNLLIRNIRFIKATRLKSRLFAVFFFLGNNNNNWKRNILKILNRFKPFIQNNFYLFSRFIYLFFWV